MNLSNLAPLLAIAVVTAACSAGGGGGVTPSAATGGAATSGTSSSAAIAHGTLVLGGSSATTASGARRKPAYVSVSTTYATLFIDGAVSGNRQACTSSQPCTINFASTSGSHAFVAEIDDGSAAGNGNVLAAGSETAFLNPGSGNTLPVLTLYGVPATITYESETLDPVCPQFIPGAGLAGEYNCAVATFGVQDADGNNITTPGSFYEGQLSLIGTNPTGDVYSGLIDADGAGNDYNVYVACNAAATGSFALTTTFSNQAQTTVITAGQFANYSLTFPSPSLVNWPTYNCFEGTVSAAGPANGSVTVQSTKR